MVHAKAGHAAVLDKPEDERMGGREDLGVLHADGAPDR